MNSWQSARARVAINSRHHGSRSTQADEARRDLRAARLEAAITSAVNAAPPLTDEQRSDLAQLLRGAAA